MPEHEEALVLKTEPSGESFIKLYLLTAESGIFLCMKRNSKKANSSTIPDLFDTAVIHLETSQQGTMRFVKEYQLKQRRDVIGQDYRSLLSASRLSQLLLRNASHMPESEWLFRLTERAFNAFAEGKAPDVVLLKSLYLLLKNEGYPVRESWWPTLRADLRETAKCLLSEPSPVHIGKLEQKTCEHIEQNLTDWMRHQTDLIIPD
ncbi:MAG: hypothetical protein VX372_01825 [Verrucomicrobiota bacterium]|nr:hypothetical protein [Verrucomicrobiota bacterium]MEC8614424.1 hypothetical protein [Verrucomicrobiota bacterium]MEE2988288.1 hypothetical protein [Verrucomicrobiota bacterium]